MEELNCKHKPPFTAVCPHVFNKEVTDGSEHFVGSGMEVEYICESCIKQPDYVRHYLCQTCIESEGYDSSWPYSGTPEIVRKPKEFIFTPRELCVESLKGHTVLAFASLHQPLRDGIIFTDQGQLWRINLDNGNAQLISRASKQQVNPSGSVSLKVSKNNQLIAMTSRSKVNTGQPYNQGVVADLVSGDIVMALSCGDYRIEHTVFPVEFIEHKGETLVIHATDWKRLDITNPLTSEKFTERDFKLMPKETENKGSFSEWNGELVLSPNQERIATIGWIWHPIGIAYSWDVQAWLGGSVWEAEQGDSKKCYTCWDYFWDSPFFWIDDNKLCIWGYSEFQDDNDYPLDSVAIYDACSDELLNWFVGPTMDLFYYDQYLFSGNKQGDSITVWSLEEGSLLYEYPIKNRVTGYQAAARAFVSVRKNGFFDVVQWQEAP